MYDVYGLGNALVDMEYSVDDTFLGRHDIPKGHMTLVDEAKIDASFKKGVLCIDLPKTKEAQRKVKHITVKAT